MSSFTQVSIMISHANKFIYVHIPKTGGTSIEEILFRSNKLLDSNLINLPFQPNDDKFSPPPPHFRALDYIANGCIDKEVFNKYFKFSFVRNPWDRIVSEYKYRGHSTKYDFKTFLFKHFPMPSWSDEYCHIIPQYDFIHDSNGTLLIDYVGKFETINDDYIEICSKLNVKPQSLPHKNKSISFFRRDNSLYHRLKALQALLSIKRKFNTFKHYSQYYDYESIEFIRNLYIKDINEFNYEFDE